MTDIDKIKREICAMQPVPSMVERLIQAVEAAHTAKLLAGVEMDWDSLTDNPNQSDIKEWVQQYAAAAAVKARMKALDDAMLAVNSGVLGHGECAAAIESLKGKP